MTNEDRERYSRQIMLPEIGEGGQERLLAASVLVIGAGGLGSPVIMYLAAAGVGTLGIADGDNIELSNLQRQVIHRQCDIGKSKAVSGEEFVRSLRVDIHVHVIGSFLDGAALENIIGGYDFVLDCTDGIGNKLMINDVCVKAGKPFCHGGVTGFTGQVMTWLPGYPDLRAMTGWDAPPSPGGSPTGIVGAVCGVAGSVMAMEAVKFITGTGKLLTGRIFAFDMLSMRFGVMGE